MKKIVSILPCLLLLTAGCMMHPFRSTEVYDLSGGQLKDAKPCQVLEFRNSSGAGKKMQITYAGGAVKILAYARWSTTPGLLVSRALNRIMVTDGKEPCAYIYGDVEQFSADADAKVFCLSGTFQTSKNDYTFRIRTPLAGTSPKDIVAAADMAVLLLAQRIQKAL